MQHQKHISLSLSILSLSSLIAACASDNVDLGGNTSIEQSLEVGARCVESTVVDGDVFVGSRDELEALRGCEVIRGDFTVMVFDGTDLSPLASLREVSGTFLLGATARPIPDEVFTNPDPIDLQATFAERDAQTDLSAQLVNAGWLESLHGLEGLERAGQMALVGIAAPDLSAFASLRNLGGHPVPIENGALWIMEAKNLLDLRGLEGLAGIQTLQAENNPSLQSLHGIQLSSQMDEVLLQLNPSLNDLDALSSLNTLRRLSINQSGVGNLDALANLTNCPDITVMANPELRNVDGLGNLSAGLRMMFLNNPQLESVPPFSSLGSPLENFRVIGNAALRSVSLNFPLMNITTTSLDLARRFNTELPTESGREVESGFGWYDISNNPELERVSIAGNLTSALLLEFNRNDGLSSIDLGSLRSLNVLSIAGNATLSEVGLGNIQTVNLVSVIDNPSLDVAQLRNVRTFETVMSGNADDRAESMTAPGE